MTHFCYLAFLCTNLRSQGTIKKSISAKLIMHGKTLWDDSADKPWKIQVTNNQLCYPIKCNIEQENLLDNNKAALMQIIHD